MTGIGLMLVVVAGVSAAVAAGVLAGAATLRRTAVQMQSTLETGRDDTVQRAVEQLVAHSRTVLGGERELGAAELDARRSRFEEQLDRMQQRIGEFERTVRESQATQHE